MKEIKGHASNVAAIVMMVFFFFFFFAVICLVKMLGTKMEWYVYYVIPFGIQLLKAHVKVQSLLNRCTNENYPEYCSI